MGAQVGDRLEGLGGAACGGEEDEVGGLGVGFEEFVDKAFADGEADTTAVERQLGLFYLQGSRVLGRETRYLLAPVMRTKSCSWGAAFSQGAGVGSSEAIGYQLGGKRICGLQGVVWAWWRRVELG